MAITTSNLQGSTSNSSTLHTTTTMALRSNKLRTNLRHNSNNNSRVKVGTGAPSSRADCILVLKNKDLVKKNLFGRYCFVHDYVGKVLVEKRAQPTLKLIVAHL